MQPRLSNIDLEKLNEDETLFLYGFIIEHLQIDPTLIKSIKKRSLLIRLSQYKAIDKLDKVRQTILDKIK
jgi:predicted DNA-binding ArsR family transcriptional regulator